MEYTAVRAPCGAIKALSPYRLRIAGVVYGGQDLAGERFTKQTDLGLARSPVGMPCYWDHAQGAVKSQIGHVAAYEAKDDALYFEVELQKAHRYAEEIRRLYAAGALGASTGSMRHLVVAERGELKRWIVGELSLTPQPCEPRTIAGPTKAQITAACDRVIAQEKGFIRTTVEMVRAALPHSYYTGHYRRAQECKAALLLRFPPAARAAVAETIDQLAGGKLL